MKLLVAGDVSTWNIPHFSSSKMSSCFLEKISSVDCVIFNLEGPIATSARYPGLEIRSSRIKNAFYDKLLRLSGNLQPKVYSDDRILDLLSINPRTIVTLANNHIKDRGRKGFADTLTKLEKKGVDHLGAGFNLAHANMPHFLDENCVIFNVNYIASRKWGIPILTYNATRNDYGAAFFPENHLKKEIGNHKQSGKTVILIAHAGSEMFRRSGSEDLTFRQLHGLGADLTIIHHSHLYRETKWEKKGVYVLGDYIFHRPGHLDESRPSATVEATISEDGITASVECFNVDEVYKYEE